MKLLKSLARNKKGAALVEYSLLVAGVALVSAAGISLFGHKTSDMISAITSVLPGAHNDDNGPIVSGKIIETAANAGGNISLNLNGTGGVLAGNGTGRLGNNLIGTANGGAAELQSLVVEANP